MRLINLIEEAQKKYLLLKDVLKVGFQLKAETNNDRRTCWAPLFVLSRSHRGLVPGFAVSTTTSSEGSLKVTDIPMNHIFFILSISGFTSGKVALSSML